VNKILLICLLLFGCGVNINPLDVIYPNVAIIDVTGLPPTMTVGKAYPYEIWFTRTADSISIAWLWRPRNSVMTNWELDGEPIVGKIVYEVNSRTPVPAIEMVAMPIFVADYRLDIEVWNRWNKDKRLLWYEGRFANEISRPYWERN